MVLKLDEVDPEDPTNVVKSEKFYTSNGRVSIEYFWWIRVEDQTAFSANESSNDPHND